MNKKSVISLITALLLLITLFFSDSALITIYGSDSKNTESISGEIEVILNIDKNIINKYISAFEKKYPGVKVKYTSLPDYESEIMQRIEDNNYGDVIFIPASMDAKKVHVYFEPLGTVSNLSQKYNFIDNAFIENGQVYSLPSSAYLKGFIYNKEVFNKAGITGLPTSNDEFIEDLKMIKERTDALPFYTASEMEWIMVDWAFFPFIETTGDEEYRGNSFVYDKNPFLKGGNYYEAYKLLYDIIVNDLSEGKEKLNDWTAVCEKLNKGEIGAIVTGTWAYSQIKNSGSNNESVAFMPFPNQINGRQYATIGLDYGYCICRNSKNKEAARKFIEFMLDESGYALDEDRISIVKSDPLPDVYSSIRNLDILINKPYDATTYRYYSILSKACNPDKYTSIMEVVNAALDKKPEAYDELMQSWNTRWENSRPPSMQTVEYEIGKNTPESNNTLESVVNGNYEVEFSQTEKEYIAQTDLIKVGYLTDMAPFQYKSPEKDDSSGFEGLSGIICNTIQNITNIDFVYIPYSDPSSMINDLTLGKIHMVAGISWDDANIDNVRLSKEYIELSNVILKSDNLELTNLENKRQAYVKGFLSQSMAGDNTQVVEYDSYYDLVNAIETKKADYAILNYYSANYYTKDAQCSYVTLVPISLKTQYSLAFSKEVDSRLISICNKCIYSIPKEHIQMTLLQYMDPAAKEITLKQFVATYPLQCYLFFIALTLAVIGVISFIRNEKIKSKKKDEIAAKRYEVLSKLTDEYVFEYDFSSDSIRFDKKFIDQFGFESKINVSSPPSGNDALDVILEIIKREKTQTAVTTEPFLLMDTTCRKQWYKMIAYCILGDNQVPGHFIGKLINVNQFVEQQQRIQNEADRDPLTTLYNRSGFIKRFEEIGSTCSEDSGIAFAILDIDDFKKVNDTLGHLGGDEAIKYVASVLLKMTDENTIAARYGGDEFIICKFNTTREQADEIFVNLVNNTNSVISFEDSQKEITISAGVIYRKNKYSLDELFAEADKVLYSVKKSGKNGYKLS